MVCSRTLARVALCFGMMSLVASRVGPPLPHNPRSEQPNRLG